MPKQLNVWRWRSLALLSLVAWLSLLAPECAYAGRRVALVAGNSAYGVAGLKNPVNDARLMIKVLTGANFEIIPVLDGNRASLIKAIGDFGRRLSEPGSVALFYYAGHGVQVLGDNYLVPVDAAPATTDGVQQQGVPLKLVFDAMRTSQSRLNIVLLDACRDNPFSDTAGGVEDGLAPVVAPSGTIIGYATAPGQIARDGEGDNSPYTAALAANIPTVGATVEDVFRATRLAVRSKTQNAQTPWEHSSLLDEFYFHPKIQRSEDSTARAGLDLSEENRHIEIAAWDKIRSSSDPAVLREFAANYPDGIFADVALLKASRLDSEQKSTPWPVLVTGSIEAGTSKAGGLDGYEKALRLDRHDAPLEDLAEAVKLYQAASLAGVIPAQLKLAQAFDQGRGIGKDLVAARTWYRSASEAGDAEAKAALGTMFEFGEGGEKNVAEALSLYNAAAAAGNASALANLGYLFAEGKGVARDMRKARSYYEQAADKGSARAKYNLALLNLKDTSQAGGVAQALQLLSAAAGQNHAPSLRQLASLYDEGRGVARDPELAARYLLLSLKAGQAKHQLPKVDAWSWRLTTRREVQRQLTRQGFYKGFAHGVFDKRTRTALVLASRASP